MGKIVDIIETAEIIKKLREENKKIVLAGGCFDIIHTGHITFLKNAREMGDILIVLIESDERIREIKGSHRPINIQSDRALMLASIIYTDYALLLPYIHADNDYDRMISLIKPDIIATTKTDPGRIHKERQAGITGAKVIDVVDRIENQSTSKIAKLLEKEM